MTAELIETARLLVACGKGLLAMDESNDTCNRRFAEVGISQTEDARRRYRTLLITTPELKESISGAILSDETIRQQAPDGRPLVALLANRGIVPGIKVDRGTHRLALHPGETVTEGLDGLGDRLSDYAALGARFAKWRAVLAIGDDLPSAAAIAANAQALARYAALCQAAGIVPIVEPEVLMTGTHSSERSGEATAAVLRAVFAALVEQGVKLEAMILKPNMVLAGSDWRGETTAEIVAVETLSCLLRTVPAAVAGVAFLSGGQSGPLAAARLDAINRCRSLDSSRAPWPLVFSFARAIQHPGLQIWQGDEANVALAQAAVGHRARCCHAAIHGRYDAAMEEAAS
ncbi:MULTISPECIES: class I fructose-bisphosphate aldolase [Sphingosinicellaceae]|uniref:class I fructose-bisphosphate aldolase n=1 Tax=Sphingosinicellaceae TaxID=2820280 RepID=UPI001D01E207|nr:MULTISPECIES: class I fructose-bisphosphate aldolase [Polymorphobacter]